MAQPNPPKISAGNNLAAGGTITAPPGFLAHQNHRHLA
jgi:hypothetical protein